MKGGIREEYAIKTNATVRQLYCYPTFFIFDSKREVYVPGI